MTTESIEREFKKRVCEELYLLEEGVERFRVFTPFLFEDGDHLAIVLKKEGREWLLSDEGHTFMHLSYRIDETELFRGNRHNIIVNTLSEFQVENRAGELILRVRNGQYGAALYSFVQALIKISDINLLSKERVKSTFYEDFRELVSEAVPEERRTFNWYNHERDPGGLYTVDCHVNGMDNPLLIYALPTDTRTRDATTSILRFQQWGMSFQSLGIFEELEAVSSNVLARFTDVCDKQFSSLQNNKEKIVNHIQRVVSYNN